MYKIGSLVVNNGWILLSLTSILGLAIGSFLNVVIYRLPLMLQRGWTEEANDYLKTRGVSTQTVDEPVINLTSPPRSCCPKCGASITWWQNIPILSFLLLKGRCSICHERISGRYLLVELLSGLATIFVIMAFGLTMKAGLLLLLTWALIVLSFIDLKHQMLPDCITLSTLWLGLLANAAYIFVSPTAAIIGAVSGYLSLYMVAKIFKLIRKIEGMGEGDFKLFALLGAWFGWKILPSMLVLASIMGLTIELIGFIFKKKSFNDPFPFGPYLAISGLVTFLFFNHRFTIC